MIWQLTQHTTLYTETALLKTRFWVLLWLCPDRCRVGSSWCILLSIQWTIVAMKNVLATMQVASFMQDEFPLYMYLMSSWSQGSWNPIGIVFPWVVAIVWQVYQCVYVTRTVYTHCTVYHCCECVCVCVLIMIWDHYHQSQLRLRKPGCQMEEEEELWIIQAPSHVYKSLCPYCFLLLGRLLSVATLRCTE